MDVIVTWEDNTKNCVNITELESIENDGKITLGTKVKMLYNSKWYYGTVTVVENSAGNLEFTLPSRRLSHSSNSFDSEDTVPLSVIKKRRIEDISENCNKTEDETNTLQPVISEISSIHNFDDNETHCSTDCSENLFGIDISDLDDPDYIPNSPKSLNMLPHQEQEYDEMPLLPSLECDKHVTQTCEYVLCENEVFSSCFRCSILLCWDHFQEDNASCALHGPSIIIIQTSVNETERISENENPSSLPDLDCDEYVAQSCEVHLCENEVFSSCFRCSILLCWDHFQEDNQDCTLHGNSQKTYEISCQIEQNYAIEGSCREFNLIKIKKLNKRKQAKIMRNTGQEYISPSTKKVVLAKKVGPRCNENNCKSMNRKCDRITDYMRQTLFDTYYAMGDINHQREFLARHITVIKPKQRTVHDRPSRRKRSLNFFLSVEGTKYKVCRKFFLATFSISDKVVRTCLKNIDPSGSLDKEKRGGRRDIQKNRDTKLRQMILNHIQRFPRVESHYCRANTTREYLHPDLTVKKMHRLLLAEIDDSADKPGLTLYKTVFKSLNLSFHHPKKDQCSLCATYRSGSDETKQQLKDKYDKHTAEKKTVRVLKKIDKAAAKIDNTFMCATFDLQQVLYLPITQEGAIFYKRQLSVYNLTMYNIATCECFCFTWPETESKRGSAEIATAVVLYLKQCDKAGTKRAQLYADGCAGQNKNSIVASALLHVINTSSNLHDVSLRFFTPNHGQNEGDSAHSAIQYAVKKAGDIFLPVQLHPIMRMARPAQPYIICPFQFEDFKNYKELSQKLRVLSLRKDNETGTPINWTEIVEFRVQKENPSTISFKTSHLEDTYRSITLKRTDAHFLNEDVPPLNQSRIKIAKAKYEDLMSLCTGISPIIRLNEYKEFYKNLPHE